MSDSKKPYIQVYSLTDIINRNSDVLVDKRLAIFDIGPQNNRYFVIEKPYQFTTMGLILITAGICEITINLEPLTVQKNDLLIVLPNQFFEILTFSDNFSVKAIFIDADLFIEGGFHIKSNNLIDFLSSKYPKVISLDNQVTRDIKYHLKKLNFLVVKNEHLFSKNLVLHHFSILIYELGNFYNRAVLAHNASKEIRKEELAKKFLYLVSTHFKRHRNVQYYADEMFISRKHLTKIITNVFNKPPKQIIAESIILEAKVLLKNPQFTISDVVTALNFQDTSVFSKYFKNYVGISPSAFKMDN